MTIFTGNPYFVNRAPAVSIVNQTAILYNLCIGISKVHTHQQLGLSHATIERCGLRFEQHIEKQVVHRQEAIKLGEGMDWADVECDEVTLSRRHVDADHVVWAQYLGLVQRGRPESLILVRLPDRTTGIRAPGPGPLRKRDWEPIFNRYVRGRNIILHTDSARAYESFTEGIGKTRVVHQMKRDADGVWHKPHFTQTGAGQGE